jgi:hypothetical protein
MRIEVAAALGAADALAGERVLEDLLESEELDDRQVHGRVEAQAALVRPEHRRELHAETTVDLERALVVDPRDAEHDLPLRLDQALHDAAGDELGMPLQHRHDRVEHLVHGLLELGLMGIAGLHGVEHGTDGGRQGDESVGHGWSFLRD